MRKANGLKTWKIKSLTSFLAVACLFAQLHAQSFKVNSPQELRDFFRYTPDRVPLVCGHRGGAGVNYPENCIATFEQNLRQTPVFFELDPRLTKDSVIVVLHDATLDRTTTGTGKLADYDWEDIKKLRLKDSKGNPTDYRVQTLDEMLEWSKGKTFLMLDKKDVPLEMLLKAIEKQHAEGRVIISAYNAEEASYYYQRNKNLMFEAFMKNETEMRTYEKAGIPWQNMVAYLGQPRDKSFYDTLHSKGVMCIIYTAKIIEKNKDKEARKNAYREIIQNGADIIMADKLMEVANTLKPLYPKKSEKFKYFGGWR